MTEQDLKVAGFLQVENSPFWVAEDLADMNSELYYRDGDDLILVKGKTKEKTIITTNVFRYYPTLDACMVADTGLFSKGGAIITASQFNANKMHGFDGIDKPIFNVRQNGTHYALVIVVNAGDEEYKWAYIFEQMSDFHLAPDRKYVHYERSQQLKVVSNDAERGINNSIELRDSVWSFCIDDKKIREGMKTGGAYGDTYIAMREGDHATAIYDLDMNILWKVNDGLIDISNIHGGLGQRVITAERKHGMIDVEKRAVLLPAKYDYISPRAVENIVPIGMLDGGVMKWGIYDAGYNSVRAEPELDAVYTSKIAEPRCYARKGNSYFEYKDGELTPVESKPDLTQYRTDSEG